MDDLGFAPSGTTIRTAENLAGKATRFETGVRDANGVALSHERPGKKADVGAPSGPGGAEKSLSWVSGKGFAPYMLEFIGFTTVPYWLSRGFKKIRLPSVGAVVDAPFSAAPQALHSVDAIRPLRFAPAFLRNVSASAKGLGADRFADLTERSATAVDGGVRTIEHAVHNTAAPVLKPVGEFVGKHAERFDQSATGQKLSARLKEFARDGLQRAHQKFTGAHTATVTALNTETPGPFAKYVLRRKPSARELTDALKPFEPKIHALGGMRGPAAHKEATALIEELSKAAQNGDKATRGIAGDLIGKLTVLAQRAGRHHGYQMMADHGTAGAMAFLGQAASRTKLFTAVIAVGIAAGAGAIYLSTKRQNKEAATSLQQMTSDIGDPNHPLIKEASKMHKKQSGRRWISAGMDTTMQSAMLVPQTGVVGQAIAFGQIGGMGLQALIVPENALLNAYASLRQAEEGKLQLEPAQKAYFTRQLLAAVPGMAAQGGAYNRLAQPMATELLKPREELGGRSMNLRETMQFIGNPEKFTALASDVAQKQQEAIAKMKEAQQKATAHTPANENKLPAGANDNGPSAAVQPIPTTAVAASAAQPSRTIAAANAVHEGRIASAQRSIQA